ncbi:MAG: sulfur carrier protein ThiS adenylyltransferase ThiF [Raoultibacter sp.]
MKSSTLWGAADMGTALPHARVAIAGLGGIGSHCAVFLARCGVGAFHLVDFDVVDTSNLHRQHYFTEDVGKLKTQALAKQLQRINPDVCLTLDTLRVSPENVAALFAHDALVCEAFDDPAAKALLVNAVLQNNPHSRVVATSGMAGLAPANNVCTRDVGRRLWVCGDGVSGVAPDMPLFAPRVALCAAHQAHQVLRLILEED